MFSEEETRRWRGPLAAHASPTTADKPPGAPASLDQLERALLSSAILTHGPDHHRLVRRVNEADRLRAKAGNNPPIASAGAVGSGDRGDGKAGGCGLLGLASQPDAPSRRLDGVVQG